MGVRAGGENGIAEEEDERLAEGEENGIVEVAG